MERDSYLRSNNNNQNNSNHTTSNRTGGGVGDGLLRMSGSDTGKQATSTTDFVLQWGNRKRLRCMKVQVKDRDKDKDKDDSAHRTTVRVDRRVVRADKDPPNFSQPSSTNNTATITNHGNQGSYGYLNLRQRPSPPPLPPPQRVLRNSENSGAMRGQSNGGVRRPLTSPDRGGHDRRGSNNHQSHNNNNNNHTSNHDNHNNNNKSAASSDSKKGGSSSGSGEAVPPPVWPPKFVIALTNKEKEEDFIAFKGSKLPQRPKKRAKFIQRTLNLVSPGAWLCDLTLERYEVREKKTSKKRPRGLKAMGNVDSDSE